MKAANILFSRVESKLDILWLVNIWPLTGGSPVLLLCSCHRAKAARREEREQTLTLFWDAQGKMQEQSISCPTMNGMPGGRSYLHELVHLYPRGLLAQGSFSIASAWMCLWKHQQETCFFSKYVLASLFYINIKKKTIRVADGVPQLRRKKKKETKQNYPQVSLYSMC